MYRLSVISDSSVSSNVWDEALATAGFSVSLGNSVSSNVWDESLAIAGFSVSLGNSVSSNVRDEALATAGFSVSSCNRILSVKICGRQRLNLKPITYYVHIISSNIVNPLG